MQIFIPTDMRVLRTWNFYLRLTMKQAKKGGGKVEFVKFYHGIIFKISKICAYFCIISIVRMQMFNKRNYK